MTWYRTLPFAADHLPIRHERWEYRDAGAPTVGFDVRVQVGKPLNVLSLKGVDLAEVRSYSDFLADTAQRLYGAEAPQRRLDRCTCCGADLAAAAEALRVFDVPYVRCPVCGHVLVARQPTAEALATVFSESETHSSTYVDHQAVETRLTEIVAPKIDWCLDRFAETYGNRKPANVVDVGAGGGHFLAGAARADMSVQGFEMSRASRAFAQEAFGLELRADDFLQAALEPVDLLTFWGLLEYVQEPSAFIAAARRAIAPEGMLIVEVPRVDALGTAVQAAPGSVVARHMDPTSHVNGFSDESLMTLLIEGGFKPIAVWYFGMDIYEVLVQLALRLDDPTLLERTADLIPILQQSIDLGRQCDDIIVAAVPMEGK